MMKMMLKMENRSYRYDISRSRFRHRHKYTKFKMCFTTIMVICIKQHLSSSLSLINEKLCNNQRWDWAEKNSLIKRGVSKFSSFYSHVSFFLCHQVQKLLNFSVSFIFNELTWKVADVLAVFYGFLWEYCENNVKALWYYSYENKRII